MANRVRRGSASVSPVTMSIGRTMSNRYNSGSLCDHKGGACPDCIMVPETSCVAQKRLLSRAVLAGGTALTEDAAHGNDRIVGYLEVLHGHYGA